MPKFISFEDYRQRCLKYGFTPVSEYVSIKCKIEVMCVKHGEKFITTLDQIKRCKCPKCYDENNKNRLDKLRLTNEVVDKRIYNKDIFRIGNVMGRHTKIEWKCKKCDNVWKQTPGNILHRDNPTGCPVCNGGVRDTEESFIQKINDSGRKDIELVGKYISSQEKTEFKCNTCSFIWRAIPNNITNGKGCPICKLKSEKMVGDILTKHGYTISHAYYINTPERRFLIDWFINDKRIAIEYHGKQHYEPVQFGGMDIITAKENLYKQIERDNRLRDYCKTNNIHLIEIDGRKYNYKNANMLEEVIINNIKGIQNV